MRKIYTKAVTMMMAIFLTSSLYGQKELKLTINSPDSIAGVYDLVLSSLGTQGEQTMTSDVIYVSDGTTREGCSTLAEDGTGKIMAIDRGGCNFVTKVGNAKAAGTETLIIFNNDADEGLPNMGGAATEGIYVYGGLKTTGDLIKSVIDNGGTVNLTISYKDINCPPADHGPDAFWGNEAGQGDFAFGLGDWVATVDGGNDERGFIHSSTGNPLFPIGFAGDLNRIKSPTNCNGAAMFDFTEYQSMDNPDFNQPYVTYTAELTSPTIDCSGKEFVALNYYQSYNRLNGFCMLSFSTDDGATWSEPQDVSYQGVVNDSPDNRKVTVAVPQFDNQAQCKVRFIASGDFYNWLIDDVFMTEARGSDMQINTNFVAGNIQYSTPVDQVIPIPLLVDVKNNSGKPSQGSKVTCDIFRVGDSGAEFLYSSSRDYGVIKGDSTAENQVFAEMFDVPAVKGQYAMIYSIADADDYDSTNDSVRVDFVVGDDSYMKLIPEAQAGVQYMNSNQYAGGNIHSYGSGFFVKDATNRYLDGIRFGVAPEDSLFSNGTIAVDIYSWIDVNQNNEIDPVGASGMDEKTLVASTSLFLTSETDVAAMRDTTLVPLDADENELVFEDNTQYLAMITYIPFVDGEKLDILYVPNGTYQFFDYEASSFAYALSGMLEREGSLSALFDNKEDKATSQIFSGGFGTYFVNPTLGTISSNENELAELDFAVYPTLATDVINADVNFAEATDVSLEVTSMDGKLLKRKSFSNVSNETLSMNITSLSTGAYVLNVRTKNGMSTQKFTVVK